MKMIIGIIAIGVLLVGVVHGDYARQSESTITLKNECLTDYQIWAIKQFLNSTSDNEIEFFVSCN